MVRSSFTVVLAWIALSSFTAPAQATFPGENGKIAFGAEHSLYTINPDGSGETAIDPHRNCAYDPDWSADGTRLAFDGCGSVRIVNADGSGTPNDLPAPPCTTCFPDNNSTAPSWSPDGTRIAYLEIQEYGSEETGFYGQFYIHVANVDGSSDVRLTGDLGVASAPSWSPDGTKIAFSRDAIYTMNPDGSGTAKVPNTDSGYLPSWSPDGRQLLFTRGGDLYKINVDGTGPVRLTTTGAPGPSQVSNYGAFSPDGQRIAFSVSTVNPFSQALVVMNADGSGKRALPTTFGPFGRVSWQAIPGPRRNDYKNAAQFCKAERDFLGEAAFKQRFGGAANAYGKCVSSS